MRLLSSSSKDKVNAWRISGLLFAAALIINLTAVAVLRWHGSVATIDGDEREYWDLSGKLEELGLNGIPARRTPAFPLVLAILRVVVGSNYLHVQLVLSAFLAVSPPLLYWAVRRQLRAEQAARLAGVLLLLWPPLVRYGASMYADNIALVMFLVFLACFPAPSDSANTTSQWLRFLVCGAVLGFCIQMKPLYLIYTPIAVLLALSRHARPQWRLIAGAALIVGCVAICFPWSAYLSTREGRFIPISANDGETLAGGLNPQLLLLDKNRVFIGADGRSTWVGPGKWLAMDETGYLSTQDLRLPYAQVSALLTARSRAWIFSHPVDTAYLSIRKLLYMWGWYPFWNGASQTLFGNIPLLLITATAGVSAWVNRRNLHRLAIFWSLPIFSSLVCLVSWGSWRFRMPADLGLIVLTSLLLVSLRRQPITADSSPAH